MARWRPPLPPRTRHRASWPARRLSSKLVPHPLPHAHLSRSLLLPPPRDGLSGLQVRSVNFYDKGGRSCSAFEAQPRARLCKQCQLLRGYDLQMRAIKQYNNATVLLALHLRPIALRVSEAGTPTTDLRLCGWAWRAIADEFIDFDVVLLFSFVGGGDG